MKRVVITGLGVVSPLGSQKEKFWDGITQGQSAIDKLTKLDATLYPRPLSSEISDWDSLPESKDASLDIFGQATGYSIAATRMALTDANLKISKDKLNNYSVLIGTTMGSQDIAERVVDQYQLTEDSDVNDIEMGELDNFTPARLSEEVARHFGFQGRSLTMVNACAAGNYSVGLAFDLIRSGRSDAILAGGADPFSRTCYTIFHRLNASSNGPVKPFDENRDGMVVGEGAAMLVLEEYEHAVARNAHIYAEVTGYSLTCDAYHATAPHPEGIGAINAMNSTLSMAGISPEDIDYVSAHGTGTAANDQSEAVALHKVFGEHLKDTPVSSIKSMIGHCMGAASAFEAVACALAVEKQTLPPTMNTDTIDTKFPMALDVIPGEARTASVNHVMSNAFAFGGNVSCLVFSKVN